jgi:hypothetical protein
MQPTTIHRIRSASATIAVILLILALLGSEMGRHAFSWVYLQSAHALEHATPFHGSPLDRLDPAYPQCM